MRERHTEPQRTRRLQVCSVVGYLSEAQQNLALVIGDLELVRAALGSGADHVEVSEEEREVEG